MNVYRKALSAILFCATFSPSIAVASFSPVQCVVCNGDSSFDEVSYSFKASGDKTAANWAIPINRMSPSPEGRYLDRILTSRVLVANSRVARIGVYNSFMDTEWFADSVLFGVDGYLDAWLSGDYPTGFGWAVSRTMNSSTAGAVILQFLANNPDPDEPYAYKGFDFSSAKVCCHPTGTSTPTHVLQPMERMDGLLLKKDDVIFVKVPASSTDPHKVLTLWREINSSNNFVAYGRCNADPTPSIYDFRSNTTSTNTKLVHFPTNVTSNGYWHIAINAWAFASGTPKPGYFSMMVSHHLPGCHFTDFRVGFTYSTYLTSSGTQFVLDGVRRLFGATEGAVFVENVSMFGGRPCVCGTAPNQVECECNMEIPEENQPWVANCAVDGETIRVCDLTIVQIPPFHTDAWGLAGGGSYLTSPGTATLYKSIYDPMDADKWSRVAAHELAHSTLGVRNEFPDGRGVTYYCGHTIMNNSLISLENNLCFNDGEDVCNHGWNGTIDYQQWDRTCIQVFPGGWNRARDLGTVPPGYYPTQDPDQYDYVTPRFNAYPQSVTYQ